MQQMAVEFSKFGTVLRERQYPARNQLQLWQLVGAFTRRERLTVLTAIEKYGIYALSQRVGQLKNLDWQINMKMVTLPNGKKVAEYSL